MNDENRPPGIRNDFAGEVTLFSPGALYLTNSSILRYFWKFDHVKQKLFDRNKQRFYNDNVSLVVDWLNLKELLIINRQNILLNCRNLTEYLDSQLVQEAWYRPRTLC